MLNPLWKIIVLSILTLPLFGQQREVPIDQSTPVVSGTDVDSATSKVILELHKQIENLRESLQNQTSTDPEKSTKQLSELEAEFEKSIVGEDLVELYNEEEEQSSLEEEFMNILQPIFGAVKETTASLRAKEDLKVAIEKLESQQTGASEAVLLIEKYSGKYSQSNPDLSLKLEELKTTYASRASYAEAKRQTLQRALDTLKVESDNGVGSITKKITTFLKSTGLHLLVALLVFCLIFFGANFVFKKMMDFSRKNTPKETRFNYEYLAKIDGTVFLGALTLGTLLIPVVFLIFGNWLLISIFALLSLVIFWMVKDKIPDIIEEVRLILNIGAVREQERIIYNGIPWKVDEIKFYSQIINPNLEGGRLRIPLPELVGMHSRACKNDERYFPTDKGNWVLIDDEIVGKIVRQTVERITLEEVGGSIRTISTSDFLGMQPVNLTRNGFRSSITFGIDYKYQKEAITQIEQQMSGFIKEQLLNKLDDPTHLRDFFIEFSEAAASSLNYEINAEFTGEMAYLYKEMPCYLQRFALKACNHYNWEIPFTQIQIHQS